MPTPAQPTKDTIEKIATDLQAIQDRLSKLAWSEQHITPKPTLGRIYQAQSQLCNVISEICILTSSLASQLC